MKFINLVLYLIATLLVAPKILDLSRVSERKDAIVKEMEATKNSLENSVEACKLISSIKNMMPNYDDVYYNTSDSLKDAYWRYKHDIQVLNKKLLVLCSHSSMVVNHYRVIKDRITNHIYLGSYKYPVVLCDAETIRINGKTMVYKPGQIIQVSKDQDIEIEYNKYKLNYSDSKIDTINVKRYIDKISLIN